MLLAFLPGLSFFFFFLFFYSLSLSLSLSVYVFVNSIIFHFSRSYPSLAASFATLLSLRATLLSLLTEYRDSSLPSFFHSIALLSAALPFLSLNPFPYSLFLPLYASLFMLYRCLSLAASSLSDSSFSFCSIIQYILSSSLFPVSQFILLSSFCFSFSHSPFDPVSPTLAYTLFFSYLLPSSFIYIDPSSSHALFSPFINIPFLFSSSNFFSLTLLYKPIFLT